MARRKNVSRPWIGGTSSPVTVAVGVRFELTEGYQPSVVFKTTALNRSANPPSPCARRIRCGPFRGAIICWFVGVSGRLLSRMPNVFKIASANGLAACAVRVAPGGEILVIAGRKAARLMRGPGGCAMTAACTRFEPTGDGGAALARVTKLVLGLAPREIPERVMERAALLLLDTLGVAAAAMPTRPGVIARETALRLHGTQDPAFSARLLFDGRRVSLAGAAFAAATAIDNLDAHDGYNPTKGHIGVVALPTLAALAETLPFLSGPEALAALVVGYEVAGRAATALHASVPEYHTSGAWNALGVAAMVARLRRFTPRQLREALGIAEFHGPRSQMMREIATPTMLHDGSSAGALIGVTSAIQAELGFTGAPAVTVEAPEVASHWADLGEVWQVPLQYIKPYPTCRWVHAALDGLRALFAAHDFTAADVVRVDVRSFFNAVALFAGVPDSTSRAQYSMHFPLAAMLVHRRVGAEHIAGAGLTDPAVIAMMARIHVAEDPLHTRQYPARRMAEVAVTLRDGRVLESGPVDARGGPEAPFDRDQIVAKFHEFADPALGRIRARAIRERVLGLTAEESRFADVAALVHDAPPAPGRGIGPDRGIDEMS